jgi:hypothetical protein
MTNGILSHPICIGEYKTLDPQFGQRRLMAAHAATPIRTIKPPMYRGDCVTARKRKANPTSSHPAKITRSFARSDFKLPRRIVAYQVVLLQKRFASLI